MAPSATENGMDVSPSLDAISKPPAGVVLPPKDIRAIVEKTAGYVARNGHVFEDRIREKEKHNPKFSFLSANDAYNAFYSWRLVEIKEGRGTDIAAGRVGDSAAAASAESEKPKGPPEPPEFHFSARMPNISAQDLDIVRLTALFAAKNGRSFMTALSQRESRNPQFDFLRPNHSLYQFFSRLMDQYAELMRTGGIEGKEHAEQERLKELERNIEDKFHVLGRARQRAEWVKFQETQKQKKEEAEEQERLAYAQIDWHEFVVVEEVLFTEADENADLPPPTTLNDLQSASLEQKAMMSLQPHNMRIEEAMPTDDGQYYNPYDQAQQAIPVQMPPPTYQQPDTHMTSREEDEEEARIRERNESRQRAQHAAHPEAQGTAPMKIRSDYVPRAAAAAAARRGVVQMALCPNCKQQIPYDELEQHMRIELLDPRWKEQRLKSDQRSSTTNLTPAAAAANLKRLASSRSDVFDGVTGQPLSDEEAARRKKAATNYDGQPETRDAARYGLAHEAHGMQAKSIEEQLKHIREKAAGKQ